MPKMKQATLFSMKSWKTKPEDFTVYKKKLEKENTSEPVILRTLALLNHASKESILSFGIDKTLKLLAKSQNVKIEVAAKLLIDHWGLKSLDQPEATDVSKACDTAEDSDVKILCQSNLKAASVDTNETKKQTPSEPSLNKVLMCKSPPKVLNDKTVNGPVSELMPPKQNGKIGHNAKENNPLKPDKSGSLAEVSSNKDSVPQPKSNKNALSKVQIKAIKDRVEAISKVFLESLGMQQVQFYLDH